MVTVVLLHSHLLLHYGLKISNKEPTGIKPKHFKCMILLHDHKPMCGSFHGTREKHSYCRSAVSTCDDAN